MKKKLNIDLNTNWENFYEFLSIIRNIITHDEMMVSRNTKNVLNSIAPDIYHRYFEQSRNSQAAEILKPKDGDNFIGLLSRMNDFAANTIKFIADEQSLSFLGLH